MASHLLFLDFSGGEFLLIAVVFLMFFGSKSIPDVAQKIGKAVREFKEAANNVQRDIQESAGLNEIKEKIGLRNVRRQLELMYREFNLGMDNLADNFNVNLHINLNSYATI